MALTLHWMLDFGVTNYMRLALAMVAIIARVLVSLLCGAKRTMEACDNQIQQSNIFPEQ
ncbi:hypothetical protein KCP74_21015 [Salmonella enterica subsp. enterica]|nr:hypothetical protein KCP74_21015 [Salmonella enterica subsp. enterica]